MTDEIIDMPTPKELEEGIIDEVVLEEEEEKEVIVQTPDYEKIASLKGWRPEEEYEGETPWVTAQEFVGRQPLFDAIHKLSKSNKDLKMTVDNLVDHNRKVKEVTRKQVIEELKAQKVTALENQDHAAVVEIDDQIDEVKRETVTNIAPVASSEPEFIAFLERNSWYEEKPNMARYATRIGEEYWDSTPGATREKMLAHVEEVVRDAFPEEFAPKQNPKRAVSQTVAAPKSGTVKTSKKPRLTKSDLSYEERVIFNNMLRNSPLTEEEYLDQLADQRA